MKGTNEMVKLKIASLKTVTQQINILQFSLIAGCFLTILSDLRKMLYSSSGIYGDELEVRWFFLNLIPITIVDKTFNAVNSDSLSIKVLMIFLFILLQILQNSLIILIVCYPLVKLFKCICVYFMRCFIILMLFLMIPSLSNALTDSNPSNNLLEKTFSVESTQNISLRFVPFLVDGQDQLIDPDRSMNEMILFLNKTYPVADNGLSFSYRTTPQYIFGGFMQSFFKPINFQTASFDLAYALNGNPSYEIAVGLFTTQFLFHFDQFGAHGFTSPNAIGSVLAHDTHYYSPAHEIGHLQPFQLCDENNATLWAYQNAHRDGGCPNGDSDNDDVLDSDCIIGNGCVVSNSSLLKNLSIPWPNSNQPGDYRNMMGGNNSPWIDNLTYV